MLDGESVEAIFNFYVTDTRGMDMATYKQMDYDSIELEGLWDPEPQYDTNHQDFIDAFEIADLDSDGLLCRDEAQMWFQVSDEDMDAFWDHYVTNQEKMNENQAVWAFNEYTYEEGFFYVMKEYTMECDEFHEILFMGDVDRDGKMSLTELADVFDCECGCCGDVCQEC